MKQPRAPSSSRGARGGPSEMPGRATQAGRGPHSCGSDHGSKSQRAGAEKRAGTSAGSEKRVGMSTRPSQSDSTRKGTQSEQWRREAGTSTYADRVREGQPHTRKVQWCAYPTHKWVPTGRVLPTGRQTRETAPCRYGQTPGRLAHQGRQQRHNAPTGYQQRHIAPCKPYGQKPRYMGRSWRQQPRYPQHRQQGQRQGWRVPQRYQGRDPRSPRCSPGRTTQMDEEGYKQVHGSHRRKTAPRGQPPQVWLHTSNRWSVLQRPSSKGGKGSQFRGPRVAPDRIYLDSARSTHSQPGARPRPGAYGLHCQHRPPLPLHQQPLQRQ